MNEYFNQVFSKKATKDSELINNILVKKMDLYSRNAHGQNALEITIHNNDELNFTKLMNAGFDINHTNDKGETPLMTAILSWKLNLAAKILSYSPSISLLTLAGESVFDYLDYIDKKALHNESTKEIRRQIDDYIISSESLSSASRVEDIYSLF